MRGRKKKERKRERESDWWRLAGKRVGGTEHEMRVPEFLPGDQ